MKAGRDFYVGGRLGVVIGGSTLLYGKAGYTNARLRETFAFSATPSSLASAYTGTGNHGGVRVGAGIEQAVSRNVSLKAEYRYSRYGSTFDRHQAVAGVSLRF